MIGFTQNGLRFYTSDSALGQGGCAPVSVIVRPPGGDPNKPAVKEFNPCLDDPETIGCALFNFYSDDALIRCIGDNLVANYRARIDQLVDWQKRNIADWNTAWGLMRLITQSARDWFLLRRHRFERGNILLPFGPTWGLAFYRDALTRTRDEGVERLKSLWLKPYPGDVPALPDFNVGSATPPASDQPGESKDSLIDRIAQAIKSKLGIGATIGDIKKVIVIGGIAVAITLLIFLLRRR